MDAKTEARALAGAEEVMRLLEASDSLPCAVVVMLPDRKHKSYSGNIAGAMHFLAVTHANYKKERDHGRNG